MFPRHARVLWLYGLSGAGKTTLAREIVAQWRAQALPSVLLDGNDLRAGLNAGLGFAEPDRTENIRRAAEMAALLCRQGVHVVAALVTPLRRQRAMVRQILHGHPLDFYWVNSPLAVCQQRDPGGLYSRAASGGLQNLAGIDSPFEEPEAGLPDRMFPAWMEAGEHAKV